LPPPPGGAVQPITGPNQIPFQPGPQFLQALNAHFANRPPLDNLGTPMQEAFDRADVAIKSAALTGQLVVVAFTDGQPNCFPDPAITMVPTMVEPMRAADWLASSNIKTYMVGLPGGQGVQILNQVAMSGGTMQYIIPDDPKALEDKLREVVMETIDVGFDSCVIALDPAAEVPDKLHLVVEEKGVLQDVPRDLATDAGWTITADGITVELTGRLCEDAMAGRFTKVTFQYGCVDLPPLPPPPPVE
jgi:hypothetical protein